MIQIIVNIFGLIKEDLEIESKCKKRFIQKTIYL